jgi:prepilin-type N-terminal cleavage/methylation domain-containing protein
MKINFNKGFTLIELLVVISIIGVLSSVVLASLSNARGRGNDTAIKSTLINIRTQAELVYASNYNFSSICTDPIIDRAVKEADRLNGSGSVLCVPGTSNWAIASSISSGAFCVDANGTAKEYESMEDAITAGNPQCNTIN